MNKEQEREVLLQFTVVKAETIEELLDKVKTEKAAVESDGRTVRYANAMIVTTPDASAGKRKVYCCECRHHYFSWQACDHLCQHPVNMIDTPMVLVGGDCCQINKDNNCPHFEQRPVLAKKRWQFWK